MSWNTNTIKQVFLYNDAGESQYNPVLFGLPFVLNVEFSENVYGVSGLVGSVSPPTTAFSFTQDPTNSRLWTHDGVAGTAPFNVIDALSYIRILFTSALTGDQTIWEKKLYIASLPIDAIQVYDSVSGWTSVNYGISPAIITLCAQMCPIRLFNTWFDEFRLKGYGGVDRLSVYDYGTNEGDTDISDVARDENAVISQVKYIYLKKHEVSQVENHDITIKFKASNVGIAGVEVRIKVQSLSCWGFEIKDPVII